MPHVIGSTFRAELRCQRSRAQMSRCPLTITDDETFISRIICCLRVCGVGITHASQARSVVSQGAIMRTRLVRSLAAIVLVLATATISRASTLGLDITSATQTFAPGVFNNIGWQFSVSAPITIDGLGLFDVDQAGL